MWNAALLLKVLVAALVITAGIYDIRYRRIPNWLSLAGVLAGFAVNAFSGRALLAAEGFGLALLIYFPLWLLHAMGAGDVKLMAAVGALVGWQAWLIIFFITSILGGIAALLLMLGKKRFRKTLWNIAYIVSELAHFRAPHLKSEELDVRSAMSLRLPHGAVIALGCLAFLGTGALI
jgi:prepilin peptidase CpaA